MAQIINRVIETTDGSSQDGSFLHIETDLTHNTVTFTMGWKFIDSDGAPSTDEHEFKVDLETWEAAVGIDHWRRLCRDR